MCRERKRKDATAGPKRCPKHQKREKGAGLQKYLEEGVVEDGQNFVRNRFLRLVLGFPCRLSPTRVDSCLARFARRQQEERQSLSSSVTTVPPRLVWPIPHASEDAREVRSSLAAPHSPVSTKPAAVPLLFRWFWGQASPQLAAGPPDETLPTTMEAQQCTPKGVIASYSVASRSLLGPCSRIAWE